jgi:hypothetical protein
MSALFSSTGRWFHERVSRSISRQVMHNKCKSILLRSDFKVDFAKNSKTLQDHDFVDRSISLSTILNRRSISIVTNRDAREK